MRFLMMTIPGDRETYEADGMPPTDLVERMMAYNVELQNAGVLVTLDGLHPSARGARVAFGKGGTPTVLDGPFSEAKEVVGGFWIIRTKTREEAVEWARKAPMLEGDVIELRQIRDLDDYSPEVQEVVEKGERPA